MGWVHNRYKARPPSNCKAARIAWDLAVDEAGEHGVACLWYDDSMPGWEVWSVERGDGEYFDIDALVVLDRKNNPHKYVEQPDER